MTASTYRGRFAPSPTGPLHVGSLVAALGSWLDARHHGGEWLLRIEDIDPPREREGAAREQIAMLEALGLIADGPIEFQSRNQARYRAALEQLQAGGHLFECRCTRSDLKAQGGVHRYCVDTPSSRHAALRLRMDRAAVAFVDRLQGSISEDPQQTGDTVLRRSDGLFAYQLAVVVDDHAQGVTDIVRGLDLLDSTPRQIALRRALGLPTPRYLHLPLVLDGSGKKLGKSNLATPISASDALSILDTAWHFLLPDSPAPTGRSIDVWLGEAIDRYRPACLRRDSSALDAVCDAASGLAASTPAPTAAPAARD